MTDRFSDSFKQGKRDAERSYSDFGYSRDDYDCHGSERQRNYSKGWDESREDKRYEERRREEREEQERQEQRREQEAAERRRQEQYEYDEMMEYQRQEQEETND